MTFRYPQCLGTWPLRRIRDRGALTFERRRFLFIRDPDGNVLEFGEPTKDEVSHAAV